jgi:hypothetical protein
MENESENNTLNILNSYTIQPNENFDKVNFNSYYFNIEPFVLFQSLNTFSKWLMIVCIKKSDKNYNTIQTFIKDLTHNLEMGKSVTIDTTKEMLKNNEISKHKWYSIDLRNEPDLTINNKININFTEGIEKWYKTLYFDKIYNKTKGLIIYADKLDDIPSTMHARSNIGLCTYTEVELLNFIFKCTAKYLENIIPVNKDKEIVGFINSHKWTKLVKL